MIHRDSLDLNLLTALETLLRERHVTRAARSLCISQPAMSMALARLRRHFDDPLLIRAGGRLELTARARSLLAPVQSALQQAHAVLGSCAPFEPSTAKRTFSLMLPDSCLHWLIPRFLPSLMNGAPGVALNLESFDSSGEKRLLNGELDFLVSVRGRSWGEEGRRAPWVVGCELQSVRWVCVTDAANVDIGHAVSHEQWSRLPHVVVRGAGAGSSVQELLDPPFDTPPTVGVTVDSVLDIPFVLPGTHLVAMLPEGLAQGLNGFRGLRLIDVPPGVIPARYADLQWDERVAGDPGHRWLRQLIAGERPITGVSACAQFPGMSDAGVPSASLFDRALHRPVAGAAALSAGLRPSATPAKEVFSPSSLRVPDRAARSALPLSDPRCALD